MARRKSFLPFPLLAYNSDMIDDIPAAFLNHKMALRMQAKRKNRRAGRQKNHASIVTISDPEYLLSDFSYEGE